MTAFGLDPSTDNPLVDRKSDIRNNYDHLSGKNPLGVVDEGGSGWGTGTFYDNVTNLKDGIEKGDWKLGLLGGFGLAVDQTTAVVDPIGFIASQIMGWMLEHVEPLRAVLHGLSGDPDMVKGYAESWTKIGEELGKVAQEYGDAATGGTADWTGASADAYRAQAGKLIDLTKAAGQGAHAVSSALKGAAEVVAGVRGMVRDLLTELGGYLVSATTEILASGGFLAPLAVEQALEHIAATGAKITKALAKLALVIDKLGFALTQLKNLLEAMHKSSQAGQPGQQQTPVAN